mgnify:CR=1 FL=1
MNIWAIVAVIAALIFGFCMGYITSQVREKKHVDELLRTCSETSEARTKLSREYNDFVKSAQEIDRWPKHNSHIVMKDNLADYLKTKYFSVEEAEDYDGTVCEDEVDNLYV